MPEKGDSTSSPVFIGAPEKIPNSDETLKPTKKKKKKKKSKKPQGAPVSETTEGRKPASFPVFGDGSESPQWRQKPQKAPDGSSQGASVLDRSQKNSKKGDLTSSSDASEKPEFISVASLNARDKRRQFRKKKQKAAPVPVESPEEPAVPIGSQQRGKLKIPDHLVRHLQKASSDLGAPLAAGSQQAQETPTSLQGAPVAPNGAPKRPKLKIPEPLRRELLKQKPLASSVQGSSNPAKSKQDRTPVGAAGTRQGAEVSAESPKGAAASSAQGGPMPCRITKVAHVLSGTPHGAHVPEGSPQQEENFKFPMQCREQKIPQRTPTSGDAGVDRTPPQKLYEQIYNKVQLKLKLRSQNHQLHQRTCSHLNRKRALDSAGVDQSPPPKKLRLDQQSESEQIDDLCRMFAKFLVISHI
ncbi:uncharacterized protein LOC125258218 [Megalobrama amblycephala]|uniref:uncharacterized protein LOC125258218 n=1 Tax=Megalobrama amblycephala TaxID=75352 RepID=UPI00201466C2|nr:uncharacterized protein LOC125258218 [Megalobrama amblycephala]